MCLEERCPSVSIGLGECHQTITGRRERRNRADAGFSAGHDSPMQHAYRYQLSARTVRNVAVIASVLIAGAGYAIASGRGITMAGVYVAPGSARWI